MEIDIASKADATDDSKCSNRQPTPDPQSLRVTSNAKTRYEYGSEGV
jgi:hypothetical protein